MKKQLPKKKMIPLTVNQIENISEKGINPEVIAEWLYGIKQTLRQMNTQNLVIERN